MRKFRDLNEYLAANRMKKVDFAVEIGVSRFQLSGLLYPEKYPVRLTDEIVASLAARLNRSESYIRSFYEKAAA